MKTATVCTVRRRVRGPPFMFHEFLYSLTAVTILLYPTCVPPLSSVRSVRSLELSSTIWSSRRKGHRRPHHHCPASSSWLGVSGAPPPRPRCQTGDVPFLDPSSLSCARRCSSSLECWPALPSTPQSPAPAPRPKSVSLATF